MRILGILLCCLMCLGLTSCVYFGTDNLRADAGSIFVLTPGALVYGTDATVFITHSTKTKGNKDANTDYGTVPNTFENGIRSNFANGSMTSIPEVTPTSTSGSITNGTITAQSSTTPTTPK